MTLVWTVDANGISIGGQGVPERDFTNLWAGGKLALEGRTSVLFDVEIYRAQLRDWLSPALANQEWSYPPSILLIGAPLAVLPLFPAYLVWTLATLALLVAMLRFAGTSWIVALGALAGPATLASIIHGQNGALTAALLVPGFMMVDRRPVLAGILFGLLTVKPQLGLLIPVCLIAGGHWRVIASAALTAIGLAVVTGMVFGWSVWTGFMTVTRPVMLDILNAPYPTGFQMNATTFFVSLRAAGADLLTAQLGQGVLTVLTVFAAVILWRRQHDPAIRAAATIPLVFLGSTYGYNYDMAALSAAILILVPILPLPGIALGALLWLWPALTNPVNSHVFPLTPFILLPFAVLAVWTALRQKKTFLADDKEN